MADTWSSQPLHAQPTTSCRDKRLCKHVAVYHRRHATHQRPRAPLSRLMNCELVAAHFSFFFLFFFQPRNKLANDWERKYCRRRPPPPPPRLCPHDCSGIFMQMAAHQRQRRCHFQLGPSSLFTFPEQVRSRVKFPTDAEEACGRYAGPPWQQVRLRFQDGIYTVLAPPRPSDQK